MRPYDIIRKTRDGIGLSREEISFLIDGYVREDIEDYQMAAWAMAVYFRGMKTREIAWLTEAMVNSGTRVDLSGIEGIKVDKHSTGGVGDTTTMVLAPLVAAAGVPVAKMSGRGLGHTGGTLDKLESFPGFQVNLSMEEFVATVNKAKVSVIGQTAEIVPADGKLYSLRDVTATVDSIPLIASSIMSKKIASGADALVLDVKVGSGAFMGNPEDARQLAKTMVDIGENLGLRTVAVLSAMDRPLGRAVGNALEVKEAIAVLRGEGPEDLRELCLELGSRMLVLGGGAKNLAEGRQRLEQVLASGAALDKLRELVANQGGDAGLVDQPQLLPTAQIQQEVAAPRTGWITEMDTAGIGNAAQILGAGRSKKGESIDLAVGLEILAKTGDHVEAGQPLAILHANSQAAADAAAKSLLGCYSFGEEKKEPLPLILGEIGG
ncbi:MAG: pyrimidine-nucleoside phosphorylase [Bacillota bacterium]|jgi:pyrimidine-nucleoside phosphorylase|nr:pyrimidine-nucleoside phosphorylase [Bacillota bacterium]HPZ21757.1 pyrimidine-nucleoside phosphorylase [Bacillota bacterium]HQD19196.1 pyrimidine-nucleoside phosphorylase [Bacillota bacterium]